LISKLNGFGVVMVASLNGVLDEFGAGGFAVLVELDGAEVSGAQIALSSGVINPKFMSS
jgi:hypothetical protein